MPITVAMLLDATVVRKVILPTALALLGDASWYLPAKLRWLPRIDLGES